jgi:DNA polymerase/3'-5' exonuclease PolX
MPKRYGFPSITLEEGYKIFNRIKKKLPFPAYVAGSIRRESPLLNDIDIIIIPGSRDLTDIMLSIFEKIEKFGDQIINGVYRYHDIPVLIDFFITTRKELPYSMIQWTGPKTYNMRIRKYVRDNYGWLLNQHGLFYHDTNKHVTGTSNLKTEKEIINFIGTTYYKPYERS